MLTAMLDEQLALYESKLAAYAMHIKSLEEAGCNVFKGRQVRMTCKWPRHVEGRLGIIDRVCFHDELLFLITFPRKDGKGFLDSRKSWTRQFWRKSNFSFVNDVLS